MDGSQSDTVKKTLYLSYTSVGTNGTTTKFSNGQVLTSGASVTANVITSSASVGTGSIIRLGAGIIYAKDHFIRVDPQVVVVGNYSANTTKLIGYDVSESIVTSSANSLVHCKPNKIVLGQQKCGRRFWQGSQHRSFSVQRDRTTRINWQMLPW